MNRFVFLCHVREDEDRAKAFSRSLVSLGMRVLFRAISPFEQSKRPHGVIREQVQTGLIESCYGVVLITRAFVMRDWPLEEWLELSSRIVDGEERLLHVLDVTDHDLAALPVGVALRAPIRLLDLGQAAAAVRARIRQDDVPFSVALRRNRLKRETITIFRCRECGNKSTLALECLTAAPLGSTGVLVCSNCGRGFPIRNGIPQLLGEGAINPDEPEPPSLEPSVDLNPVTESPST